MAAFLLISVRLMFVFYNAALMGKHHPGLTKTWIAFGIYSSFNNTEHSKKICSWRPIWKNSDYINKLCLVRVDFFSLSQTQGFMFLIICLIYLYLRALSEDNGKPDARFVTGAELWGLWIHNFSPIYFSAWDDPHFSHKRCLGHISPTNKKEK